LILIMVGFGIRVRLASALAKRDGEVRVFLLGDAVTCAMADQQVPNGY